MGDSNQINMGAGAQAHQVAAGNNISQTYIAQQIVNAPPQAPEWQPPKQMLNVVPTFVGRQDELRELATLGVIGVTTPRFLIAGVGGLGKTSLAAQITRDLESQFTGGILLAEIPTVDVFLKLGEWAELYGGDVKEIQDVNQRADRVRQIIQQRVGTKRVLAVLDGVVDESDDAKLAPLLRALRDCAVLVTSRAKNLPSLFHFREIGFKEFDAQNAVDLFNRILPQDQRLVGNESQIHALHKAVDSLPFALELLAKQLVKHREWSLTDLENKFAQSKLDVLEWGRGQTKDTAIRASFFLSYRGLDADEQTFFTQLGAFGGRDFDVQAAAYVGQVKAAAAEKMLEHLLELSMAQTGRGAGRYTLHALMREFARELCSKNLYDAELHMATYYCAIARENGDKLYSNEIDQALAILDAELTNISTGQKWARENATQEARELTRDFIYGAITYYFRLRANWAEWIEWSEYGIAACQALEDERGEGAIAGNLGIVYRQKGEWDKAIEFYQNALQTMERLGDVHGMAQTYINLGSVYADKGEWDKAIAFYQQSLEIKERVGDVQGMAQTYMGLGIVYANKGEWDKAIEFYQNALQTMERLGDVQGMAQTYGNLGNVYLQKGEWDKAIAFYQNALQTMERLGDVHGMAQTYGNLGAVYYRKGEWDKAIEFYQQSLVTKERLGDVHGMAQTYINLGAVYYRKGEWDKAIEFYQNALETMERLGDVHGMAQTYGNLGLVYADKGEWDKAIAFYQKDLAISERLGDVHGMAQTYGNLGLVYADKGEWDKAIEFYQKDLAISERLGDVVGMSATYWNIGTLYEEQDNLPEAIASIEKAVAIKERIGHPLLESQRAHLQELKRKLE